jgi:flavin-dependent thymidylate synthase
MKVRLGGYNLDVETIRDLAVKSAGDFTPEVISASYARISRDPRAVTKLREEARRDVESARKSNSTIVFGLGHSSIAEHAVFNFDVMGISRLAVEAIEHFRLASFTEKSQRYIKLGRDFVVPDELSNAGLKGEFERLMDYLAGTYEEMYRAIREAGVEEEGAKEDARYLMPLATTAQFGMTINARELEYMISRLASHPLAELREFASKLSGASRGIAPSLIKYPDPTDYFRAMPAVRNEIGSMAGAGTASTGSKDKDVLLVGVTDNADRRLAAALIFSSTGVSFSEAMGRSARMGKRKRAELISSTMRNLKAHDSVWREFESIRLQFEVKVSASCFAQLKRHRMATIIVQDYTPSLGISVPDSVGKARKIGLLRAAASRATSVYRKIEQNADIAGEYALINAHRRRVLFDINLRELYHFSRLRSDIHAQWEIRRLSENMCALASNKMPLGSMLLCGKDSFDRRRNELFCRVDSTDR